MTWKIQNQILVPIVFAMVVGISLSTYFNIRGLVQNENSRVQSQVEDLFRTLSATSFPLTPSVLSQVEQLTGIHLLVVKENVLSTSYAELPPAELAAKINDVNNNRRTQLHLAEREFSIYRHLIPARKIEIHALYPREQFFAAIRKVIYPQVVSGVLTLVVVGALVILVARNVTLPIQSLKQHVREIAEGDFSGRNLERKDEIGQLFQSINEMAERLQLYEKRIRAQEKLLTLDQMGGGIAHQMRNSITGCRLALDLHRHDCQGDQESMDVAIRQLTFMEDFQKRFLSFTKETSRVHEKMDLVSVVCQYTKLLEPFARHVNVSLEVDVPETPRWIAGNEHMIQQLVGNLVTNAIEAASTCQEDRQKQVVVQVHDLEDAPALSVRDSGDGIPPRIKDQLFEPLVTTKPDGVGLGLAIVKQTVNDHQARIRWSRQGSFTQFDIVFPNENHLPSNSEIE